MAGLLSIGMLLAGLLAPFPLTAQLLRDLDGGGGPALPASPSEDIASFVWVDEHGVTHFTNDPGAVPDARAERAAPPEEQDRLAALWDDGVVGPSLSTPPGSSGSEGDRVQRLLAGVASDLQRGEHARAAATLRSLLRLDPSRAEPHWYLALLDQRRGRYASAQDHLRVFLSRAGDDLEPWRAEAARRLGSLGEERRLADPGTLLGPLRLVPRRGRHFRLELDRALDARPAYAATVLRYLEEARRDVASQLGVVPTEPLGVVFYGRAEYLRAHEHRFSFQTVGFFDGRIHVSSTADPGESLRALLYHEYTHAVYREQTGSDRPYWLNEGIAELVERRARRDPTSTRSERAALRTRIAGGDWIALRRIAPSFAGLTGEDVRAAYLEAIMAGEWIEEHTDAASRALLLMRLGEGWSIDQALHEAVGLDTEGLDAAVRERIANEFTEIGS